MRIVILAIIINLIILSPVPAAEVLTIGGTGSALGTMKLLASAFEKIHPGTEVNVLKSLGSSGGIKAVAKGAIDIGLSSRLIREDERSEDLQVDKYSMSPLAIITNKDVNIQDISTEQLVSAFRGKTSTWPDGHRIRPIMRPATEIDIFIIKKISLEMRKAVEFAYSRKGLFTAVTDQECISTVERVPGAFGFSTLAQIISEKRRVNVLAFNGITPSVQSLSDFTYHLFRSYYLVINKRPSIKVRNFLNFIYSSEGRSILEKSGNLVVMPKTLLNHEY